MLGGGPEIRWRSGWCVGAWIVPGSVGRRGVGTETLDIQGNRGKYGAWMPVALLSCRMPGAKEGDSARFGSKFFQHAASLSVTPLYMDDYVSG